MSIPDHLSISPRTRLIAFNLALVAVLAVVVTELAVVRWIDSAVVHEVHERTAGWLTEIVTVVTQFGGTAPVVVLTVVAVGILALLRHWQGALALALSVGLTQAAVAAIKLIVERPRPDDGMAVVDASGSSFPSAHSATAVAVYAMLALIISRVVPEPRRWAAYLAAGLAIFAIGASRIYLGAHYPTDVLAGWLIGGALVLASWAFALRLPGARTSSLAA